MKKKPREQKFWNFIKSTKIFSFNFGVIKTRKCDKARRKFAVS
jgi:hypothetical protein